VKNYQCRQRLKKKKKRSSLRRQCTTSTTSFDDEVGKGVLSRAFSDVSERIVGAWEGLQLSKFDLSNEEDDDTMRDKPLAIIFIDEIDALAKKRDTGFSSSSLGGNDEREQTLNQLLTEMDGFKTGDDDGSKAATAIDDNVTVIVIAATNRPHVLDPAILRSGRFDRRVAVHLPDCQGREDILRLHARHIRYDESSVNLGTIAKMTPNFSGADLKTLINEAALLAVRNGSTLVLQEHLVEAAQKIK
jgi:ATP-dependent Zn protease